jgi:glycerol-3-phosphate dehydrogenase
MNDVDYLLKAVNNMFPAVNLSAGDIVSSWSGLRPLIYEAGKKPSEMSRKDEIFVSDSGLISIAGGKLTGYRLMAKNVVDLICKQLEISQDCRTESIRLIGGEFKSTGLVSAYITNLKTRMKSYQLNVIDAEMLVRSFGKQTDIILNKTRDFEQHKLVQALAWFCLRNEQVSTLADFYIRRTGFLYFQPEKISESLEVIVPTFSAYLKWDGQRIDKERLEMICILESINKFSNETI